MTVTDPRWVTYIKLGTHTWTLYENLDPENVDDDATVIGGLNFGWDIPGDLHPVQPDPMFATLALNVPDFSDFDDLTKGDVVAINVKLFDSTPVAAPVVAEFYGRITDLKARPRRGRPGVTLFVTAVDYTVDLAEETNLYHIGFAEIPEVDYIDGLATNFFGDDVVADGIWTGPTVYDVKTAKLSDRPKEALDKLLFGSIWPDTPSTRQVVSPVIFANILAPAGRFFTLDTIAKPDPADDPDATFSADHIDKAIEWAQIKGQVAAKATITYPEQIITGHPDATADVSLGAGDHTSMEIAQVLSVLTAQAVAEFYLTDPDLYAPWWVDKVSILPYLVPLADREVHAADLAKLFPHWTEDEEDPYRSDCYVQRIRIEDTDGTLIPFSTAGAVLEGTVRGAALTISRGRASVDLKLRDMTIFVP